MRYFSCIVVAVVPLLMTSSSKAQSSNEALAEDLLAAMRMPEIYALSANAWSIGINEDLKREHDMGRLSRVTSDDVNAIAVDLGWEKTKPEFVTLYANALTQAELTRALDFFRTPSGQYLIQDWLPSVRERRRPQDVIDEAVVKEFQGSHEGISFSRKRHELLKQELAIRESMLQAATRKLKDLIARAENRSQ